MSIQIDSHQTTLYDENNFPFEICEHLVNFLLMINSKNSTSGEEFEEKKRLLNSEVYCINCKGFFDLLNRNDHAFHELITQGKELNNTHLVSEVFERIEKKFFKITEEEYNIVTLETDFNSEIEKSIQKVYDLLNRLKERKIIEFTEFKRTYDENYERIKKDFFDLKFKFSKFYMKNEAYFFPKRTMSNLNIDKFDHTISDVIYLINLDLFNKINDAEKKLEEHIERERQKVFGHKDELHRILTKFNEKIQNLIDLNLKNNSLEKVFPEFTKDLDISLKKFSQIFEDLNKAFVNIKNPVFTKKFDDYLSEIENDFFIKYFAKLGESQLFFKGAAYEKKRVINSPNDNNLYKYFIGNDYPYIKKRNEDKLEKRNIKNEKMSKYQSEKNDDLYEDLNGVKKNLNKRFTMRENEIKSKQYFENYLRKTEGKIITRSPSRKQRSSSPAINRVIRDAEIEEMRVKGVSCINNVRSKLNLSNTQNIENSIDNNKISDKDLKKLSLRDKSKSLLVSKGNKFNFINERDKNINVNKDIKFNNMINPNDKNKRSSIIRKNSDITNSEHSRNNSFIEKDGKNINKSKIIKISSQRSNKFQNSDTNDEEESDISKSYIYDNNNKNKNKHFIQNNKKNLNDKRDSMSNIPISTSDKFSRSRSEININSNTNNIDKSNKIINNRNSLSRSVSVRDASIKIDSSKKSLKKNSSSFLRSSDSRKTNDESHYNHRNNMKKNINFYGNGYKNEFSDEESQNVRSTSQIQINQSKSYFFDVEIKQFNEENSNIEKISAKNYKITNIAGKKKKTDLDESTNKNKLNSVKIKFFDKTVKTNFRNIQVIAPQVIVNVFNELSDMKETNEIKPFKNKEYYEKQKKSIEYKLYLLKKFFILLLVEKFGNYDDKNFTEYFTNKDTNSSLNKDKKNEKKNDYFNRNTNTQKITIGNNSEFDMLLNENHLENYTSNIIPKIKVLTNEILIFNRKKMAIYKHFVPLTIEEHGISYFLDGCRFIVANEKIYISGGRDEDKYYRILLEYDYLNNRVKRLSDLCMARAYHKMLFCHNKQRIYILGGENNKSCEFYDFYNSLCLPLPNLNEGRSYLNAYITRDGKKLYALFGLKGRIHQSSYSDTVEMLNLDSLENNYFKNNNDKLADMISKINKNNENNDKVKISDIGFEIYKNTGQTQILGSKWEIMEYRNLGDLDLKFRYVGVYPLANDILLLIGGCLYREINLMIAVYNLRKNDITKVESDIVSEIIRRSKDDAVLMKILAEINRSIYK